MTYGLKNNVVSKLTVGIGTTTTSISVTAGEGQLFINNSVATLESRNADGDVTKREIVLISNVSGNTLTVQRKFAPCVIDDTAQNKTKSATAQSFSVGDTISIYLSSEAIQELYAPTSEFNTLCNCICNNCDTWKQQIFQKIYSCYGDYGFGCGCDGDCIIDGCVFLDASREYHFKNLTINQNSCLRFVGEGVPRIHVLGQFINNGTIDLRGGEFVGVQSFTNNDGTISNKTNQTEYDSMCFGCGGLGTDGGTCYWCRKGGNGGNANAGGNGRGGHSGRWKYNSLRECIMGGNGYDGPSEGGAGGGGGSGLSTCGTSGNTYSEGAGCAGNGFNGGDGGNGFCADVCTSGMRSGSDGGGGGGGYFTGNGGNGGNGYTNFYASGSCVRRMGPGYGGDGGNAGVFGRGGNGGIGENRKSNTRSTSFCCYDRGGIGGNGGNGFEGGNGGTGITACCLCCTTTGRTCGGNGGMGVACGGNGGDVCFNLCANVKNCKTYSKAGDGGNAITNMYAFSLRAKCFCNNGMICGKGGNGGNGGSVYNTDGQLITSGTCIIGGNGGKGGNGANIMIFYKCNQNTGSIECAGGTGGTKGTGKTCGTNGANGTAGSLKFCSRPF